MSKEFTPIRREKRARMRVSVAIDSTTLPLADDAVMRGIGSNTVKKGIQEIIVYESDIPKVMAAVERERALLDAAAIAHENGLREWVFEKTKTRPSEDKSLWTEAQLKAVNSYTGNAYNEFTKMTKRSRNPLDSAEVIERDIDAPAEEESEKLLELAQRLRGTNTNESLAEVLGKMTQVLEKLAGGSEAKAKFVGKQ